MVNLELANYMADRVEQRVGKKGMRKANGNGHKHVGNTWKIIRITFNISAAH